MAMFKYASPEDNQNDIKLLNDALFFENRGVWAYSAAAGKLSKTEVGKAVLSLGLENQADHKQHQEMLISAIRDLGGNPVEMKTDYDLSSLIKRGEGNLDNDVNIATLALGLEVGAALGYVVESAQMKSPALIEMLAGIACVESIHVARIRLAFNSLGMKIPIVPSPLLSTDTRSNWVIKVEKAKAA
jgi:hypothetical protein